MPNDQELDLDWKKYLVTVAAVEKLTGYRFFTAVDPAVAAAVKSGVFQP
jgi:DNA/RNA endonuclease G (NUC1)